jgi:hypothetical protein
VEQFERIRRDVRDEGLSIRALTIKHKVHRREVRQALADATPPPRKTPVRVAPVLGPHVATVRGWLTEDLDARRKQRHTARRVWQRLIEEEGVSVAESSVRSGPTPSQRRCTMIRDMAPPPATLVVREEERLGTARGSRLYAEVRRGVLPGHVDRLVSGLVDSARQPEDRRPRSITARPACGARPLTPNRTRCHRRLVMDSTVQEITDVTVDVLDRVEGPQLPAGAVFSVLCPRLDSPGAVLQRTAWRSGETAIRAHGLGSADVGLLIAATHALRQTHPLMFANAAGDLTPATAQTAAGGWLSWRPSPARSSLVGLRGWDQMVSLPLRGGPTEVVAFTFSRAGRDYDQHELAVVASVQPLLRALDRRARLITRWREEQGGTGAESRAREAGLTGRELSVLLGLAEGLTAVPSPTGWTARSGA